jgi:GH24 family phage-related lysozyme (muramidase)
MGDDVRKRVAVALLSLSAAGLVAWQSNEGFSPVPYIPTQGDVPTIGHGSTHYEDGTPVTLKDKPITRERAAVLARNLSTVDEKRFAATLPGVSLHQEEFDLYLDFVGQYGIGNWAASSMRRNLVAGDYRAACDALLRYRFQAGRDCRLPQNWGPNGCKGVWTRQEKRHAQCLEAQ